ncbi:MAG: hypothetical protein NTNFB01_21570 [Nitrospira sp.]
MTGATLGRRRVPTQHPAHPERQFLSVYRADDKITQFRWNVLREHPGATPQPTEDPYNGHIRPSPCHSRDALFV